MKTLLLGFLLFLVCFFIAGAVVFEYFNVKYANIVDQRLKNPIFAETAKIYAAPPEVRVGQKLTATSIAQELQQAGYSDGNSSGPASQLGTFELHGTSITVHPGAQSYHSPDAATIEVEDGKVAQISSANNQALAAYELEPQMITGLSGANRSKRRIVTFNELPPNLVNAVTSIEDRRFFEHGGVDYYSMIGSLRNDLASHARTRGGSTLTMQLAKGLFLSPEKTFRRKLAQVFITFQLEHRYTKQQIFELYANQINLGQRGSFAIDGFGEAAQAYFGKDIRKLDLSECALLAGLIQSPSRRNPYRHPEAATIRRNVVLDAMVETGKISADQAARAKAEGLHLAPSSDLDAGEAPYFVDLVRDQLTQKYGERDINQEGLRIYTSLDPALQRMATEAVELGMRNVDALVRAKYTHKSKGGPPTVDESSITYPQVALVALNPHTGQVLALSGGRNYGTSQLDHALAKRPTGSIFKPFVYAAAFNTSLAGAELSGQSGRFTPVSMLTDEQGDYDGYTPRNFKGEYHGQVTALYALEHSLNNATLSLAQSVGFDTIASLARASGVKAARGTPSVALGSYDATPLEMAGAYTTFGNNGVHIVPWTLASVRQSNGDVIDDFSPDKKQVLDPRVAYMTTFLMEGVMNNGYGYEARKRGFMAPAAGKTGTSHDAWFAGYTSNLLCVVWVGNDDYTDLKITGALAAAPIWAEFMKHAVTLPQYSDTENFTPPSGIVTVSVDRTTGLLADDSCKANSYTIAFLEGTEPTETCSNANNDQRNIFQRLFGFGSQPPPAMTLPPPAQPAMRAGNEAAQPAEQTTAESQTPQPEPKKKPGFFGRLFGRKDKSSSTDTQQQQPPQ